MPGYTPAVAELDAYCREHDLTGSESITTVDMLTEINKTGVRR